MKKIEFLFLFYYKIEITWKIFFQLALLLLPHTNRATADCTFEVGQVRMSEKGAGVGKRRRPRLQQVPFNRSREELSKARQRQNRSCRLVIAFTCSTSGTRSQPSER